MLGLVELKVSNELLLFAHVSAVLNSLISTKTREGSERTLQDANQLLWDNAKCHVQCAKSTPVSSCVPQRPAGVVVALLALEKVNACLGRRCRKMSIPKPFQENTRFMYCDIL